MTIAESSMTTAGTMPAPSPSFTRRSGSIRTMLPHSTIADSLIIIRAATPAPSPISAGRSIWIRDWPTHTHTERSPTNGSASVPARRTTAPKPPGCLIADAGSPRRPAALDLDPPNDPAHRGAREKAAGLGRDLVGPARDHHRLVAVEAPEAGADA